MLMHVLGRSALALLVLGSVASEASAHDGDRKILDKKPGYAGAGWRNQLKTRFAGGGGQEELSIAARFGHENVSLLAWLPFSDLGVTPTGNVNSCFGYTSPSGREYALVGDSSATSVVDITQPGNPVVLQRIDGPDSFWRDVRTFGPYAYSVSEGGGGIQVIDLSNVDNGVVTLANTVLTGGEASTHTLEVNTESGRLYRTGGGGGNGLRIYDLNANPASPTYLGAWTERYVHEAQVVTYPTGGPGNGPREIAICCGGFNQGYLDTGIDILDVTNAAAPVRLLHVAYGASTYSHQAWLSPDRQFLFHNDELDDRPFTRVFDASNLNAPITALPLVGEYQNGVSTDHNLYTKGSLVFHANYRSGMRVFDTTSGVTNPTLTAWFDTYLEDDGTGLNGLWKVYPYFPSGVVIGSDLERGLFVWWVGAPQLDFTFPQAVPTRLNPAGDAVIVRLVQNTPGVLQAGSQVLYLSTGGNYTPVALTPIGGDLYRALIPPLACGAFVDFYLSVTATNGVVWTSPAEAPLRSYRAQAAIGTTALAGSDFEADDGGFARDTANDTATSGTWVRVDPIGTANQPGDDHTPGAGTTCWVTGQALLGGAPNVGDVDGGFTSLLSGTYDLSGYANPVVGYWRWFSNNGTVNDNLRVDISGDGGASWTTVETILPTDPQTSTGWFRRDLFPSDYFAALPTSFRVRFVVEDVGAESIVEAAIDDFTITEAVCVGHVSFCTGDGTGGPCPCGNTGASGAGCANSLGLSGRLAGSGSTTATGDTFVLSASGLPASASVLFFQGTLVQNGGLGTTFGDGLRCAAGSVVRLGTKTASAGTSSYPQGGDPSVSVRGGVGAGDTRTYQAWYRNAAAFCTSSTFNLTNGVAVIWGS